MDTSLVGARLRRFLEQEPVVWPSTVRPNGGPHLVPIWFWWDGEIILVFSKPDAQKVRNLRANAAVMLALGNAEMSSTSVSSKVTPSWWTGRPGRSCRRRTWPSTRTSWRPSG